jgi:hypothetical protein
MYSSFDQSREFHNYEGFKLRIYLKILQDLVLIFFK